MPIAEVPFPTAAHEPSASRRLTVPGHANIAVGSRFQFIDGLRGLAAAGVVVFHVYTYCAVAGVHFPVSRALWRTILGPGALGVQVFFVISGFVIAHSLRDKRMTAPDIANFVLRRQVRLDPAYWACLVVAAIAFRVQTGESVAVRQFAVNMFYLQGIVREGALVGVSWTLCLEIQFYMVFVLLLATAQRGVRFVPWASSAILCETLVFIFFGISVLLRTRLYMGGQAGDPPWFIVDWYLFGLGALVYLGMGRRHWVNTATLSIAVTALCGLLAGEERMLAGAATAASIYVAARRNCMGRWLANRPVQYLGSISYSVYLVHWGVLTCILDRGFGRSGTGPLSIATWSAVGIGLSVVVAHALHVAIERPSRTLATRLRRREAKDIESISVRPSSVTHTGSP